MHRLLGKHFASANPLTCNIVCRCIGVAACIVLHAVNGDDGIGSCEWYDRHFAACQLTQREGYARRRIGVVRLVVAYIAVCTNLIHRSGGTLAYACHLHLDKTCIGQRLAI